MARFTSFTGNVSTLSAGTDIAETGAIRDSTGRTYKKSGDEPGTEQESPPGGPQVADQRAGSDRAQRVHRSRRGGRVVRGPRARMATADRGGRGGPQQARSAGVLPAPSRDQGVERALVQLVSQLA